MRGQLCNLRTFTDGLRSLPAKDEGVHNLAEGIRSIQGAAEERSGLVRWLRLEFQRTAATQTGLDVEMEDVEPQPARVTRLSWPPSLPERVRAVRDYLAQTPIPVQPETVARVFTRARVSEITAILETLAALGQAKREERGYRA